MKNITKISLSILLVSIMLIGFAWAGASDSSQDDSFEEEYYFPAYGANTFDSLKKDSSVIESRGAVPELTDDKTKVEWVATLRKSLNNSGSELHPYMKECGGPLLGFGVNYGGYIFVEFDKEVGDIDQSTIDKFYSIVDTNAKKLEISNVPVIFRKGEEVYLDERDDEWSDMIGGIRIIYQNATNTWYESTLSFAAEDSTGTKGFVISGHSAMTAGSVGGDIYQPSSTRKVGEVTYITGHFADAAWVEASNVEDDIYYEDVDDVRDVRNYYDPNLGSKVYMSGITSGRTYGYVEEEWDEINHPVFGTLYDQLSADYDSDNGDSGAPIFKKYGNQVMISGVHWGSTATNALFSPISGVELDLDVEPLM